MIIIIELFEFVVCVANGLDVAVCAMPPPCISADGSLFWLDLVRFNKLFSSVTATASFLF